MATLLQFRRRDEGVRRPRADSRRPRRRSAEITIFPGVRIERQGQHLDDCSSTSRDGLGDPAGETA